MPPGIGCRSAPAPGLRTGGSGMLWYVGNHGAGWSSSIAGTQSSYLRFLLDALTPHFSHYRTHGFQLRCLQEEGAERHRPRAAADTAPVCCTASETMATAGRRQFLQTIPANITCTSTTASSTQNTPIAVHSVFRCVASRNREQVASGRSLRAAASGTLQRKAQPSCAERHRAPPGVAEARATLWVAVVQLADQL